MSASANSPVIAAANVVFALRRLHYRLRYPRLSMGRGVQVIGRLQIRGGTEVHLGDHVRIRRHVRITGGGVVKIGAHTRLNDTWIVASERVDIGESSLIADCGVTDSDFHNLPPDARHDEPGARTHQPVSIGHNTWIGLSALILKGSTIGADSVVGAGSVVRGEVEPAVVVTGNPAKVVKHLH